MWLFSGLAAGYRRLRYVFLKRGQVGVLEGALGIRWIVEPGNALDRHLVTGGGVYSPLILDLLPRLGDSESIACDVGSNAGYWALPMARFFGSVHAFEADSRMFQKIQTNVAANSDLQQRIRVTNAAVSASDGRAHFSLRTSIDGDSLLNTGLSSLISNDAGDNGVMVDTVTLDSSVGVLDRRVGLIKIDVEGAESLVLAGAAGVIARDHPTIFWEATLTLDALHQRSNVRDSLEMLNSYGYEHRAVMVSGEMRRISDYGDLVELGSDVDVLSSWTHSNEPRL
jgi:FkbM family methyltransferase